MNSQRLEEIAALTATANARDTLALSQALDELLPLAQVGLAAVGYVHARAAYNDATIPGAAQETLCKLYQMIATWHTILVNEGAEYVTHANAQPAQSPSQSIAR